jgi:hypothetical protein
MEMPSARSPKPCRRLRVFGRCDKKTASTAIIEGNGPMSLLFVGFLVVLSTSIVFLIQLWLTAVPVIEQRSLQELQAITADEARFIVYATRKKIPACPDCQKGHFLEEPRGELAINVTCSMCYSEFKLVFLKGHVHGKRLSVPGPRYPGESRSPLI